jgi:hypothetical protein
MHIYMYILTYLFIYLQEYLIATVVRPPIHPSVRMACHATPPLMYIYLINSLRELICVCM